MASFSKDLRTIPNIITVSRIALVIIGVTLFYLGWPLLGVLTGAIAGVTDYLDGYLARRLNQVTMLGEVLDQFCDIFLESACILMLIGLPDGPPPWTFFLYLLREFWVTTIRRLISAKGLNIPSSIFGKLKTNFIGWSFVFYFLHVAHALPALEPFIHWIALFGYYVGLTWSYISLFDYTRSFIRLYPEATARV
ncbi:MAG: CDP-alcohol phosphatidyltransferase family protein [Myxococcales bacterium]|nr:CDP-alcohol phosphatidyltransferase family protein [Myxococcales bacterium]